MSKSNGYTETAKLDSELLRTFLAVAREGSFSRAGAQVFRSQSAVSLQIKQLEAILGRALFRRHARGVEMTATGEKLREPAQQVIALLDRTIGELRANPLQGSIRIGIPDEYGGELLSNVIAQFLRDHPGIELAIRCGFSADFPAALETGELDLAVHAVETPGENMRALHREPTRWVTSARHSAETLDPLPVAVFDRACWWRDRSLQALADAGRAYRVVFSSESVTGVAAAVAAGVAVGVLGESSLRDDFTCLTAAQGFTALPDSILVLQSAPGIDTAIERAVGDAFASAFGQRLTGQARVAATQ